MTRTSRQYIYILILPIFVYTLTIGIYTIYAFDIQLLESPIPPPLWRKNVPKKCDEKAVHLNFGLYQDEISRVNLNFIRSTGTSGWLSEFWLGLIKADDDHDDFAATGCTAPTWRILKCCQFLPEIEERCRTTYNMKRKSLRYICEVWLKFAVYLWGLIKRILWEISDGAV